MTTSTDVLFAEDTSHGTGELHLSEAEAAAIKGFGKSSDSLAGISDEEVAAGMQAFIEEEFGGASVDKTDPVGIAPASRKKLTHGIEALRKSSSHEPRRGPKLGVTAIRDEARARQSRPAEGRPSTRDTAAAIKGDQPSTPASTFRLPAVAEMDPRLDKWVDEARAWMFAEEAPVQSADQALRHDDVVIGVSPEYSRLTPGERRRLYKSRMREVSRRRIEARKNREQAGKKGPTLLAEVSYHISALKARIGRVAG